MALYFITGIAGSGKTSICRELKSRGYEAYDTDDDGFSKWQHNIDEHIHPKSSVKSKDRTPEFLASHSWNIPRQEAADLAKAAENKPIFLCGVADNAASLMDLFEKVFALSIDDETLKHRLVTRDNNDWGKQQHELEHSLSQNKRLNKAYKSAGFTIIDASQPLDKVVDEVIPKVAT